MFGTKENEVYFPQAVYNVPFSRKLYLLQPSFPFWSAHFILDKWISLINKSTSWEHCHISLPLLLLVRSQSPAVIISVTLSHYLLFHRQTWEVGDREPPTIVRHFSRVTQRGPLEKLRRQSWGADGFWGPTVGRRGRKQSWAEEGVGSCGIRSDRGIVHRRNSGGCEPAPCSVVTPRRWLCCRGGAWQCVPPQRGPPLCTPTSTTAREPHRHRRGLLQ